TKFQERSEEMHKTIMFCTVVAFATIVLLGELIAAVKLNKNGDDDLSFISIIILPFNLIIFMTVISFIGQ
ncbi:hypothetical protein, partial [Ligilactobacillus sp. 110_WCHN]|uniref:hypothetical protein n=1 Tax=Ligilactobacillus sp. 110_WCHN TaxID=3057125 RepID=UPI0026727147